MRLPLLAALLGSAGLLCAADSPPRFTESADSGFQFSLVPRALQKDPKVDVTVITEMTPEGRKCRAPTARRPVTYLAHASGYHDEGQGFTGERPLTVATMQRRLEKALAEAHYLTAPPAQRPELTIFFVWGAANTLDPNPTVGADPADTFGDTVDIGHKNLLTRAALVGGEKFAHALEKVLNDEDLRRAGGMPNIGVKPVEQFEMQDPKNLRLVEQAEADCFYVVASAYDTAALAHGRRVLLWRTKMTANSQGISMEDTLPSLAIAGVPYFGKEMSAAATLSGHLIPLGSVEVGTPVPVPEKPAH